MTEALGIDLSSALEALRDELESAWTASRARRIRFRVSDVTLTVQAVAGREAGGGGKLRWWIVEAGAEAKFSRETTQTLVLKLSPQLYDEAGDATPLDVHGEQSQPGG
jgi:hypothetical protein